MFKVILTTAMFTSFLVTSACSSHDFSGGTKIEKGKGHNLKGDGSDGSDGADGADGADASGGIDSGVDSGDGTDGGLGGSDSGDGSDSDGGDDSTDGNDPDVKTGKLVVAKIDVVKGCSDIGSKHSGSTVLTANDGVTLVMVGYGGVKAITQESTKAKDLRDDIVDYGTFTLKTSALPTSDSFALALCDVRYKSECMSALESISLSGNADDLRHFTDGIVGYGKGFSTNSGKLVQTGSINALYKGDDKFSSNSECEVKKSPLVFDLDGSGIVLSRPTRGVDFDIDHNGVKNRISWPTKSNAGFLALDLNHNGAIDNGAELFGDSTMIGAAKATNGFHALGQYDQDQNGIIDQFDAIYSQLVIWVDINHNGVSEPGELHALAHHGITAVNLAYRDVNKIDQFGNAILQESTAELQNQSVNLYDLWFRLID